VFSRFLWLPDIAVKFDFAKKCKPEWGIFTHSGFSFHGLAYDVSVRRTAMFISRFVQILPTGCKTYHRRGSSSQS